MEKGRVLKSHKVTMAGPYRLELGQSCAAVAKAAPGGKPSAAVSASPQARVVETNAKFAVLEVTCGCGETTLVKCSFS